MKKERNAFFQNQSASSYFYPSGNMGMPMATESSSNFYQGPVLPQGQNDYMNEIESRFLKLERMVARLDTRVTKLESEASFCLDSGDSSSMYVI